MLSTLQAVCIPVASGGNQAQIAKAAGFRKSGDGFVLRNKDFQITVEAVGLNPGQCHVDITHGADQEAPGRAIVVALHDWAAITRGWSLYRNDKNVNGSSEFTTRSWEHAADGKSEAIVFVTIRKADGTPSKPGIDTSQMIYSVTKTPG